MKRKIGMRKGWKPTVDVPIDLREEPEGMQTIEPEPICNDGRGDGPPPVVSVNIFIVGE